VEHLSDTDRWRSIAVLPFVDMSLEKKLDYFCDGMAEEIINALTKVSGLRVIARNSTFQFKRIAQDVCRFGAAMNVGTVLDGSVRAAGNRLRVITRLTNTADGYHLWSDRFDRNLDDVFAVQDEISRAVVDVLRIQVGPGTLGGVPLPGSPSTRDFDAYTLYLKGRHHWNKRTEGDLRKSLTYFQASIEKDPGYAEAYAGLAEAHATLGLYGAAPAHEVMPKARIAARQAMDLAGTLSSPSTTLGCVEAVYDWAWSRAERHFRRALDLNPNHPSAHHWYAINYLVPLQRFDEAETELRRAFQADPLSLSIRTSFGMRSYFAHRYASAYDELLETLELDAGFATARLFFGLTLAEMTRYDDAIRELETALQFSGGSPETIAALGYAFGRGGNIDRARRALAELIALSNQRYVSPSLIAQVHAGLGDIESALDWLERAGEARAPELTWLAIRPVFDGLRAEARFQALQERLGQPDPGL
jgi:serine/threonine-protein kinase